MRARAIAARVSDTEHREAPISSSAITGFAFVAIGYAQQVTRPSSPIAGIRRITVAAPILSCLLPALAIAAKPLRRDTHRRIVAALARRNTAGIMPLG